LVVRREHSAKSGIPQEFTFVSLIYRPLPITTLGTESVGGLYASPYASVTAQISSSVLDGVATGGLQAADTAKRSRSALNEVAAEPSKRQRGDETFENKGKGKEIAISTEVHEHGTGPKPPALALVADEAVARAPAEEKADKRIAQVHTQGAIASVNPSSSSMEHAQKSVSEAADRFEGYISKSHDPSKDAPRSVANSSNTAINPVPQETSEKESFENPNNSKLVPEDYSSIFGPIQSNICIQPHIAGFEQSLSNEGILLHHESSIVHNQKRRAIAIPNTDFQGAAVLEQVGEKFFEVDEMGVETGRLYNFANLPGGLEDMVELP
jgi:hypothetical protein